MRIFEAETDIPAFWNSPEPIATMERSVRSALEPGLEPIRCVVSASDENGCRCEIGVAADIPATLRATLRPIFDFRKREGENATVFNAVFLVPTGIGSSIGGHAGDATPAARLVAAMCDRVILHPNVVNASDVNEMPTNALYVEGSVVTRLLMGTVALAPVRANRILTIMDAHPIAELRNATINTVSAARASYGARCDRVVLLDPPIDLASQYSATGRAVGTVDNVDGLLQVLTEANGQYDAVALATVTDVPFRFHSEYFSSRGEIVNPWGGAEAILTHTVSSLFNVPAAHAPITSTEEVADIELGIVDPRMAAEAISYTYFQCVLKGLMQSPRIVEGDLDGGREDVITAEDVSCIVMPDKCIGLPTLAALEQGIPVIAVRENENILDNDLTRLPWAPGQLHIVQNYWEAAGVMAALKAGIDPGAARRPLADTITETVCFPAAVGSAPPAS